MAPKKWDMDFIKKFIVVFGPISSIFDFITFGILLFFFNADAALFQTAWFVESICTQTLVIFVIRTRVVPFYHSRPNRLLAASTILIVAIACILPFTLIGSLFGFIPLPASFYAVLAGLVISYLVIVETGQTLVLQKICFSHRDENSLTGQGENEGRILPSLTRSRYGQESR